MLKKIQYVLVKHTGMTYVKKIPYVLVKHTGMT